MRDSFIRKLTELALVDDKIFLLVGDLGYGVVEDFASRSANQFLHVLLVERGLKCSAIDPDVLMLQN